MLNIYISSITTFHLFSRKKRSTGRQGNVDVNHYTEKPAALLLVRNKINMKALLCVY